MDVTSFDHGPELFVDKCGKVLKSVPPNIFHHQGMWPIRVTLQMRILKTISLQQDSLEIEADQGFSVLERGVCLLKITRRTDPAKLLEMPAIPTSVSEFRHLDSICSHWKVQALEYLDHLANFECLLLSMT